MEIKQKLNQLNGLYAKIEKQVDRLQQSSCVSCVQGCGECCKRFEPYISVLEAVPVAQYLKNNPKKYQNYQKNNQNNREQWKSCPLYDEENPNHCTIYTIRPLICRLFGFSANRTRKKEIVFSTCSKIESAMPHQVEKARKLAKAGLDLPVYQDIASTIQEIDFDMATDYHPFSKSVDIALEKYDDIMSNQFSKRKTTESFSYVLRKKIRDERT